MTDWLLQQQGVLSVTLLLMLFSEKCLTEKLGAKLAYQLWLFVPLVLFVCVQHVDCNLAASMRNRLRCLAVAVCSQ